jgi:TPR repeat protein
MAHIPNFEYGAYVEPDLSRFDRARRALKEQPQYALSELEELASLGSVLSMVHLGDAYKFGRVVPADWQKAEYTIVEQPIMDRC